MNEQEIMLEEIRAELRRAILILKASKYIVNEAKNNYDEVSFDAEAWDKKASALVEDIDMFVTKAE